MTSHEKAELDQMRTDIATVARRLIAHSGGKPDLMAIVERYDGEQPVVTGPLGQRVAA